MKNILTEFVIIFVFAVTFNACVKYEKKQEPEREKTLTITEGVLSVGIDSEYYDSDGKTPVGFDIELINALAEKMNLQVIFINTSLEGIPAGLNADRFDIAVNMTITPDYQEKYNFTNPYIKTFMVIIGLKGFSVKIEKPEDIAGKRAAYQSGTNAQYFTEKLREQEIVFTSFSYDKIFNCFEELALKRIDLIVADSIVASDYADKQSLAFEVVWKGQTDEYIGIALKKGNDDLTLALNNTLDELFEDGTMREISHRIFNINIYASAENQ